MATAMWRVQSNGDWNVGTRWSTGTVPGAQDDAELPAGRDASYVVSVTTAIQAHSLTIDAPNSNPQDDSAVLLIEAPGKIDTLGGDLVNGGTIEIDSTGSGGSTLTVGGTIRDHYGPHIGYGSLYIGSDDITTASTVTAGNIAAGGDFHIHGGTAQAILRVAAAAPKTLSGSYDLAGNALLIYGGGGIAAIGGAAGANGTLALQGAARVAVATDTTTNSALDHLASVAGTLTLSNGEVVTSDASLNNAGDILVGDSSLTVSALHGGGFLTLEGRAGLASLTIKSKDAPAVLSNNLVVRGRARATFTRGIKTISASGSLDILGRSAFVSLPGDTKSNSGLAALATVQGLFELERGATVVTQSAVTNTKEIWLRTSGTLTAAQIDTSGSMYVQGGILSVAGFVNNTGNIEVYDNGSAMVGGTLRNRGSMGTFSGGTLDVAGKLVNSGTFGVGAGSDRPSRTTVTCDGLTNTGTISLGGTSSDPVTMLIRHGAAPATLTGTYQVTGESLLEFAGGAIDTISENAKLAIEGPDARVALSSDTSSNSALVQLTRNDGSLLLVETVVNLLAGFDNTGMVQAQDSSLMVSGALQNSGAIDIFSTDDPGDAGSTVSVDRFDNTGTVTVTGVTATNGDPTTVLSISEASTDAGSMVFTGPATLALGDTLTVTGILTLDGATLTGGPSATGRIFDDYGTVSLTHVTIAAAANVSVAKGGTLSLASVTVHGSITGAGDGTLDFVAAGTQKLDNIAGFSDIVLADGGPNRLTLTDANFFGLPGPLTIVGGNYHNKIDGSSLGSTHDLIVRASRGADVLTGGAGDDIFYATSHTAMTGGGGSDLFVLTMAVQALNKITDFVTGIDRIAFSNAAYNLGVDDQHGTATAQTLDPSVFSSQTNGTFASTDNRFAYNASTGVLYYDADGSGSASAAVSIARLSSHPALAASDLFFTA